MSAFISPAALATFRDRVAAMPVDQLEEVLGDLNSVDASDETMASDLPRGLPQEIRKALLDIARAQRVLRNKGESILNALESVVDLALDKKEREYEAQLPKCKCCHQTLPKPKSRKR